MVTIHDSNKGNGAREAMAEALSHCATSAEETLPDNVLLWLWHLGFKVVPNRVPHTRKLADRMLVALQDRVDLNTRREATTGLGIGNKKAKVRLNESSKILGILRNVVAAWDASESQIDGN